MMDSSSEFRSCSTWLSGSTWSAWRLENGVLMKAEAMIFACQAKRNEAAVGAPPCAARLQVTVVVDEEVHQELGVPRQLDQRQQRTAQLRRLDPAALARNMISSNINYLAQQIPCECTVSMNTLNDMLILF